MLQYIVACALPGSQSVAVSCASGNKTYPGRLGLASAWGNLGGSCTTAACREWVSACVIAHSNFTGETGVDIQVAGDSTALTGQHNVNFPNDEAAYWGDIFNEDGTGATRYGCSGSNAHEKYTTKQFGYQELMSRVCGYFDVADTCQVCDSPTAPTGKACSGAFRPYLSNLNGSTVRTCASLCSTGTQANGGFFNNCTTNGSGAPSRRVITVWRKPSSGVQF